MSNHYSRPFIVAGVEKGHAHALTRLAATAGERSGFSEAWLQEFLFTHPEILPIEEIEPVFSPAVPICRELRMSAGSLDILYGTPTGLLTLVECKLWKNPEARRTVVGQILDYAKDLSRSNYGDLQNAVGRAGAAGRLYDLLAGEEPDLDESRFVDAVSRNLRRGRFLLLIVGDGIRESVEQISDFLQTHAQMNFAFALVEAATFSIPAEIGGGLLVQPRVLCRTVEIERAVIRVEDGSVVASPVGDQTAAEKRGRRTRISEQVFYESLDAPPQILSALKAFFARAEELGLIVDAGDNSLMIKTEDGQFNFATFRVDGTVRNYRIAKRTKDLGFPESASATLSGWRNCFQGERWTAPVPTFSSGP